MSDVAPLQAATGHAREAGPLEIARVEAIPVALPLVKPVVMAAERIERAQNLIVRIEAENGLVGWGEASSAAMMTGDLLPGMVAAVDDHLRPLLVGKDAMQRAELGAACARALMHNTGAKCAVDMALQDLVGRYLNVSIADLFGGAKRDTLRPMYLLGNKTVEDDIAEAQAKLAEGWSFFKLKVGIKPPAEEAAAAVAIRKHLGDDVALCADANMGMSFANARLFAERARDANLLFIEQPLHADDLEGMARLAAACPTPLNADEAVSSISNLLALHRMKATQGANLKTIKLGGIAPVVEAMNVCGALGLRINLACKMSESSIGAAALAQLGALAPNLDWGISVTHSYLVEDVSEQPLQVVRGRIERPRGPGLGIEVSESRVRRFAVK